MDGKLLVLCDEEVTLDEAGNRSGSDKHKDIINCLELTLPLETVNTQNRDIYFVDWKTVMPDDLNFLRFLKRVAYNRENQENMQSKLFKGMQEESLMEKIYMKTLLENGQSIDFSLRATNNFFDSFTDLLEKNRIVRVMPCFSSKLYDEHKSNRIRVLNSWDSRNKTFLEANGKSITKAVDTTVLQEVIYNDFGEIYCKAKDEILKIMSLPDFGSVGDEDVQR